MSPLFVQRVVWENVDSWLLCMSFFFSHKLFVLVIQRKMFTGMLTSIFFFCSRMINDLLWCQMLRAGLKRTQNYRCIICLQHLQCNCGRSVGVRGSVIGKTGWMRAWDCFQPVCRHNVLLCFSGWRRWTWEEILWRAAFVCLCVIPPRCVPSSKHGLQFACLTSSSRAEERWWVGGVWVECRAGGSRANLVGGHSVALCTCRMWITSELKNSPYAFFSSLFSFKEWNLAIGGALGYEEWVTQGEREPFSWTHFMDVLGSTDGNAGGSAGHSSP